MQIDELIVKIVMDTSGFAADQQKVRDDFDKTKEKAKQTATEAEKAQKRAEDSQKKASEATLKRQKEIDEHSKRLGETLGKVTGTATMMFAALTGGQGIQNFLSGVNASNAATSRLSLNLGLSGDKVAEWQRRMIAAGGSAEDANSALGGIADAFQKLSTGQQIGNGGFFQRMGLNAKDLENSSTALDKIGARLREIQKSQGRQAALGIAGASGFLTQAQTNYLLSTDAQRATIDAKARATAPKPGDLSAAQHHEQAMSELSNAMSKLGTNINTIVLPAFDHLIDGITGWITRISQPGHEGEMAATLGGGAVAAAAALAIAKRTVQGMVTKAITTAVGSAVPNVAAPTLLGRLGNLLGWGARSGLRVGGAVVADQAVAAYNNTTNDGEAEALAKMRANGQIPQRAPAYTGDAQDGLLHKSSFTAGESLNQRVDNFWSTFGNGLIEWLDRQSGNSAKPGGGGGGRDPNISNASYQVPGGGGGGSSGAQYGGSRGDASAALSGLGGGAQSPMSEEDIRRNMGLLNGGSGSPQFTPPATGSQAGPGGLFAGLESKYHLPGGILDSIWAAESNRGQNHNRSSAGAEGHFQFMPGTARQYGVKNVWDLNQSATGAAKYLSDMMKMFRGDYRKAIAGYNWGQGHVMHNERDYGSQWDQHLNPETRNYLSKVTRGMDPQNRYANSGAVHHTSSATIGDVHIHTSAQDARGISNDIQAELQQRQLVAHANTGLA